MKATKLTLTLALMGAFTLGLADATNIDTQIEAIQNAPKEKRVELMNKFKQQLANMNQEERSDAIAKMQERMQAHMQTGKKFGKETAEHAQNEEHKGGSMGEMTRERAHEIAQEHQMHNNEHTMEMQNMNQQQAGHQFNQHIEHGTMPGGNMQDRDSHTGGGSFMHR